MSTYEHGKTHIEWSEVKQGIWYVIFNLTLLIGYLYISEPTPLQEPQPSFRSDLKCTEGNLFSYQMADTVITYKPTKHRNPLTGTIDKFYGE